MNSEVLHDCLVRLLPHVDSARIALTGGVAIGLHVANIDGDSTRAAAAEDIDFVAESATAVRPTVTAGFLVSHVHLPQSGHRRFLVQLVDPVTRLRLDFFPDTLEALGRASVVNVVGVPLRVLEASDVFEHKVRLLAAASSAAPVEGKHYRDAMRLAAHFGHEVSPLPRSQRVSTVYSQDLDDTCARCHDSRSAAFPIAPKRAIFEVLGYV